MQTLTHKTCTNTHFLKHTHPSVPPPYPSTCYCHNPQQDCYTPTHVSASSSLLYAAKGIAITQAISLHSHSTEHMQYTPTWGHPLPKPPLIHPPSSACSYPSYTLTFQHPHPSCWSPQQMTFLSLQPPHLSKACQDQINTQLCNVPVTSVTSPVEGLSWSNKHTIM